MGLNSKEVSDDGPLQTPTLELPKAMKHQEKQEEQNNPEKLKCPRCGSCNTKFCYYNNYNKSQPRHFCKACKRHWTKGGSLRNVPVGGGGRNKNNKHVKTPKNSEKTKTKQVVPREQNGLPFMLAGSSSTTTPPVIPYDVYQALQLPFRSSNTNSMDTTDPSSFQSSSVNYSSYIGEFADDPSITSMITPMADGIGITDITKFSWDWDDINMVSAYFNIPSDDTNLNP